MFILKVRSQRAARVARYLNGLRRIDTTCLLYNRPIRSTTTAWAIASELLRELYLTLCVRVRERTR